VLHIWRLTMAERNPIETLAGISDAPQQPESQFAERLLDDLLTDLVSEAIDVVGDAPVVELRAVDAPQTADVPAMDLLTGANERTENVTRNRIVGGALAIAAAIALIVGGILLVDDDDDVETSQETGATTTAPPTSSAPVFGSAQALSVVDAYFAANGAGDFAALRALFTLDADLSSGMIGEDEMVFAWNVAQGTTLSARECAAAEPSTEDAVIVICTFLNHDAVVQAVDGPPVPIRLALTITPDGIGKESGSFGKPDFNTVANPLDIWMKENHPEDVRAVGFGNWTSIEEAEQNGALFAQYAAEWAAYLEANGCEYDEGC